MKKQLIRFVEAASSRRGRWVTLLAWLVLVGLLSGMLPNVNKVTNDGAANLPTSSMSVQADQIYKKEFPKNAGTPLLIVWYRNGGLTDQDLQSAQNLYTHLADHPVGTQSFIPPLQKVPAQALKKMASKDGTTLVTPVLMKKSASTPELANSLKTIKAYLTKKDSSHLFQNSLKANGLHVRFTGPVGIATDATALFSQADVTLLIATVLLVLILLILLYRSPILAIIPLIGVGFAYGAIAPILGELAKLGVITVDSQGASIMTVLLFGAGTDYCLFLVAKYRETLFEEKDPTRALQLALRQSGGAIMVSALTVVLSLLTLLFAHYGSFERFAIPFSLAILIMGIAALTLIPALLSFFGRISFFPFIPRTEAMMKEREARKGKPLKRLKVKGKLSQGLGKWVTQKPWTIIVISALVLVVFAAFVPQIKTTQDLISSFPKNMPSREGYDLMSAHFSSGELAPVQVTVNTEGKSVDLKAPLNKLAFVASVGRPTKSTVNPDYQSISLNLKNDPYDPKAVDAIPKLNKTLNQILTNAGVTPAHHFWIGGETSSLYDTGRVMQRDFNLIVPIVVILVALLLLIYLRSIVAMIYLILTVMLSYLSAMGLGWLLLHYGLGIPAISNAIPLYAFVFLVALGEDYNIFMVSSIWENRQKHPHKIAIANGVSGTSSVITSAGLILAGTFAVLATLPIQVLLQFGIITALGVLLDTFIVRPLLVPSITTVLGKWAYWPGRFSRSTQQKSMDQSKDL